MGRLAGPGAVFVPDGGLLLYRVYSIRTKKDSRSKVMVYMWGYLGATPLKEYSRGNLNKGMNE